MLIATINTVSLLLCVTGTFLLFKFGLPFKQRTKGVNVRITGGFDEKAIAEERKADRIAWLGLSLVAIGTGGQIVTTWLAVAL